MTALNALSGRSPKVRIPLPPLDRFQVGKLEPRILPRTFRTLAELVHPPSTGLRVYRLADGLQLQGFLLAVRKRGCIQVSLQGLLARKPAAPLRLRPARARAVPTRVKVALTVLCAHVLVFEGLQAEADAAVQVLLGDLLLARWLALVRFFLLTLDRIGRRI